MLGYQIQILRPLQPIVVGALSEELDSLGDQLGQIHDLSFLAQRLRKERGESHWGKQDEELLAVIDAKRAKLQREGISIAAEFFASRRPAFSSYIKKWFKDWRRPNRRPAARRFTAVSADTR